MAPSKGTISQNKYQNVLTRQFLFSNKTQKPFVVANDLPPERQKLGQISE